MESVLDMLSVENRKRKRLHKKKSQVVNEDDTNFDILVKKPKTKPFESKRLTSSEKNARKKLKKKLDKLEEKRKQKSDRKETLAALQQHALSNDELKLFHSSCGRANSTLLIKEHTSRQAMIISHRKKNKRNRKLERIMNPKSKQHNHQAYWEEELGPEDHSDSEGNSSNDLDDILDDSKDERNDVNPDEGKSTDSLEKLPDSSGGVSTGTKRTRNAGSKVQKASKKETPCVQSKFVR